MEKELINLVYDHYKDSCHRVGENVRRRERLMVYEILILSLFALSGLFPSLSSQALNQFLDFKYGLTNIVNLQVIGNVIWFTLLLFTIRYFQVSVFLERQYAYLHLLEEELNKQFGQEVITREGKSYLTNYPTFSNWMSFLYTVAFPTLLMVVSSIKIWHEWMWRYVGVMYGSLLFNISMFILLIVSVVLYLFSIHSRKK